MSSEAQETLESLLTALGFDATVQEKHTEDGLLLDVEVEDSGRLIGRKGQTLTALQYLVNRMLHRASKDAPKVTIDIGRYRAQLKEELIRKATEGAEKCRRWGDVVELPPMSAFDRRIVHHALKDDEAVQTVSIEVENNEFKALLIKPAD